MRSGKLLVLLLALAMSTGCAIYHHYGPYYGMVIDTVTKEPLEGAAVLAVYYTQLYTPAGTVGKYLDAQETVTDKNGEFRIPSNNTFAFRPLNLFDSDVQFTIFKPGYGYYPRHPQVKPKYVPNWSLPSDKSVVVELPKLKIGERFSPPPVNQRIPYDKQKIFIEVLNTWQKQIGGNLYTKEDFKRR